MLNFQSSSLGSLITDAIDSESRTRNGPSGLLTALETLSPPPCVGCPHLQDCATNLKACNDFRLYVDTGMFPVSEPAMRVSSTRMFERIYRQTDYSGKRRGVKKAISALSIDNTVDAELESHQDLLEATNDLQA